MKKAYQSPHSNDKLSVEKFLVPRLSSTFFFGSDSDDFQLFLD